MKKESEKKLVQISADLVTRKNMPSSYVADHPKRATRRYWQDVMDRIDARLKDIAVEINSVVNSEKRSETK